MRTVIIHVLCEGQTEQGFVEEVLKPYLIEQGVSSVKSVLVTTNKKKNGRRGNFPWIASAPLTKYLSTTFRI